MRDLASIEDTLRNKDYNEAENRLREMLKEYPREPRIFFALGQNGESGGVGRDGRERAG